MASSFRGTSSAISPSLQSSGQAFEVKYLLDDSLRDRVIQWVGNKLKPDPHCDASASEYDVYTTYYDSNAWDIFNQQLGYRSKFRSRSYGDEKTVYFEQKTKRGIKVEKRRSQKPLYSSSLQEITEQVSRKADHQWFYDLTKELSLSPKIKLKYRRLAMVGSGCRLTIDRCIESISLLGREKPPLATEKASILPGQHILELKYKDHLPALFADLIKHFRLSSQAVSKYGLSVNLHHPKLGSK